MHSWWKYAGLFTYSLCTLYVVSRLCRQWVSSFSRVDLVCVCVWTQTQWTPFAFELKRIELHLHLNPNAMSSGWPCRQWVSSLLRFDHVCVCVGTQWYLHSIKPYALLMEVCWTLYVLFVHCLCDLKALQAMVSSFSRTDMVCVCVWTPTQLTPFAFELKRNQLHLRLNPNAMNCICIWTPTQWAPDAPVGNGFQAFWGLIMFAFAFELNDIYIL